MEIYNKLFKLFNPADLLLTGNKRLIPVLHKAYAQYQQTQKKQVWCTPSFLTFTRWLETLWIKQFIEQKGWPYRLLNSQQELLIWNNIIQQSADGFIASITTAKNAQQAWQLLQQAQLDFQTNHFKQSTETETWQNWAKHFIGFCRDRGFIDLSSAVNYLILLFKKKILTPPPRIFLLGFTEINPQYKKLLNVLEELHCHVCYYAPIRTATKQQRLCLADKATEHQSMARWAYQSWQLGKKHIGCVIPNLVEQRAQLLNTFTEVFSELSTNKLSPAPFNIAAGTPLLESSLIQTATLILSLKAINRFQQTQPLLHSPYLAGFQQEQGLRAQLDMILRNTVEYRFSLEQLLKRSEQQACVVLSRSLTKLSCLLKKYSDDFSAQPSFWSDFFSKKLEAMGWPGDRLLTSHEFQLLERWSELLTELASLDFILGDLSQTQALQLLDELMGDILFQSKTLHEPPIQVLGLLDSAGMYFDELWVMGLDDRTWPASAKPNPFIPYALQRKHQIPYASSEREYYFASLLTTNLIHCAENSIFSYPTQHLDQLLRPSVLIQHLPEIQLTDLKLPSYQTFINKIILSRQWEFYTNESFAVPLEDNLSSGTQLLQSQASCPFQAFARWRLNAQFLPFPHPGLHARERGILLHQILETFWNEVSDQATLLELTATALDELILTTIDHCLGLLSQKYPMVFKTQFIHIERQRLQILLKKIMNFEKQRPIFFRTQHEIQKQFTFGQLTLSLRIDRIDQLDNARAMIIDYKTGMPNPIDWLAERCDYPQLPLYCLSHPDTVRSFAIVYLRSNKITLQGLSAEETPLKQLIPLKKLKTALNLRQWSDLLHYWQTSLEKLAVEFQQGFADVNPKHGPRTCRQCHLHLLCRINHPQPIT